MEKGTPFLKIYNSFLSKITDDMYMELTEEDTYKILSSLLVSAIPKFEFPRQDLTIYTTADQITDYSDEEYQGGYFAAILTAEEINILSTYMVVEWLGYQLASIENVRMKYSGSDFKFTSQANHMSKILQMKKDYEREGFHLQRLYKRRIKNSEGKICSTLGQIMNREVEI